MTNPALNNMFKWSIENTTLPEKGSAPAPPAKTEFDPNGLTALFGETDAEQMRRLMDVITSDTDSPGDTDKPDTRVEAFEAFEALLGSIDNANSLERLGLWAPLVNQLQHDNAEMRQWAAGCVGTAVENNARAQERLLVLGAIPTLVKLATEDTDPIVRKTAIRALSSVSRNFQPALDVVVDRVPSRYKPDTKLDAGDMSSVDSLIDRLRADAVPAR